MINNTANNIVRDNRNNEMNIFWLHSLQSFFSSLLVASGSRKDPRLMLNIMMVLLENLDTPEQYKYYASQCYTNTENIEDYENLKDKTELLQKIYNKNVAVNQNKLTILLDKLYNIYDLTDLNLNTNLVITNGIFKDPLNGITIDIERQVIDAINEAFDVQREKNISK